MTTTDGKPEARAENSSSEAVERTWHPLPADDSREGPPAPETAAPETNAAPPKEADPVVGTARRLLSRKSADLLGAMLAVCISAIGWIITWQGAPSYSYYPVNTDWNAIHFFQMTAFLCAIVNIVILASVIRARSKSATLVAVRNRDSWIWVAVGIVFACVLVQANPLALAAVLPIFGAPIGTGVPRPVYFGFLMSFIVAVLVLDVIGWRIVQRGRRSVGHRGWIEVRATYRAGRLERFESGQRMSPVPLKFRQWGAFRNMSLNDGDDIEVQGRWKADQFLKVKRLSNHSTQTKIGY